MKLAIFAAAAFSLVALSSCSETADTNTDNATREEPVDEAIADDVDAAVEEAAPVADMTAPEGSYAATCRNISMFGTTLTAECDDGSHTDTYVTSSLDVENCNNVGNDFGTLKCSN